MLNLLNTLAVSFDLPILDWIQAHLQSGFMDVFMKYITYFGEGGVFWIAVSLALCFLPKYRKTGISMLLALVMGVVVCNIIMKPLVARIRPYDFQMEHFGKEITLLIKAQHDYSFPSGHTIACFEAAVPLFVKDKKWGSAALVLAILVSFSRLYLYVHYVTDVLVSVVLGTGFALLSIWLVNLWFDKHPIYEGKYAA